MLTKNNIRDIKERYNFKISKSLGQNFLTDFNIINKIVEGSKITEDDLVIEIGPGMGALTCELAKSAGFVAAIEIDKNVIPILQEETKDIDNIIIVNEDVLKANIIGIIHMAKDAMRAKYEKSGKEFHDFKSVRVVGNLPYYITTPIIMRFLEEELPVNSLTVMMQKEVADRIRAEAGTKARGAISVAVQYYGEVSQVCKVPKEVFFPVPKVDSSVLLIDILDRPRVANVNKRTLFRVIKAGFGQRRKTLRNSLSVGLAVDKEKIRNILKDAGIEENRRAESLEIQEFAEIARLLQQGE